jgi:HK97 gp10 family phage protein
MSVRLTNRFPEIEKELPVRVHEAILSGAHKIARDASDHAPVESGTLRDSIAAEPSHTGAEIKAAWYWFFVEFGTSHSPAKPFMIPAAEANRDNLARDVSAELKRL